MELKTIGPGHAVESAPEHWHGDTAIASVSCSHSWGSGVGAVLESSQTLGEDVRPWEVVATFDRDDSRPVAMPPGRYRWRVSQGMDDRQPRAFTLDIQPRKRQAA